MGEETTLGHRPLSAVRALLTLLRVDVGPYQRLDRLKVIAPELTADTRLRSAEDPTGVLEGVSHTAVAHHVAPLACWQLEKALRSEHKMTQVAVPALMRDEHERSIVRNMLLLQETIGFLQAAEAQGIGAIPLKGPVLSERIYDHVGLRRISDIDVMVTPASLRDAAVLACSLGYKPYGGMLGEREFAELLSSRHIHHLAFRRSIGKRDVFGLELHWHVAPQAIARIPTEDLWTRAEEIEVDGHRLKVPSFEDTLLTLVVQLEEHPYPWLRYIADISNLLHRFPGLDAQEVVRRARDWGMEVRLALAVGLASAWFGARVPAALAERLRISPRQRSIIGLLSLEENLIPTRAERVAIRYRWLLRWSMRDTPGAGLKAWLDRAFLPPRDLVAHFHIGEEQSSWPMMVLLYPLRMVGLLMRMVREGALRRVGRSQG